MQEKGENSFHWKRVRELIISSWFTQNYLEINSAKTQAMAIGPKLYHYDFLVDSKSVDTTETLKILGVRKLNFMHHVKEQVKRARDLIN